MKRLILLLLLFRILISFEGELGVDEVLSTQDVGFLGWP